MPPTSGPGTTFFGPDQVENDWQYIDGLTTITFFIRTSDAVPTTGGLTIPNCLFRAQSQVLDNLLDTREVTIHIWRNQIPNGRVTFTGNLQAGSPIVTNCNVTFSKPLNGGLIPGQFVSGPGIPLRTWILSVNGNMVTLSSPATATTIGATIQANVIPKQNDVVVDSSGLRWITQRCDIQTFATRFRLPLLLAVGQ